MIVLCTCPFSVYLSEALGFDVGGVHIVEGVDPHYSTAHKRQCQVLLISIVLSSHELNWWFHGHFTLTSMARLV